MSVNRGCFLKWRTLICPPLLYRVRVAGPKRSVSPCQYKCLEFGVLIHIELVSLVKCGEEDRAGSRVLSIKPRVT